MAVHAATLTPMHPDYRVDIPALAAHCQELMKRGISGVVLFGTTGEGASFSVSERKETLKGVIAQGIDPKKIILGASACALTDVVELTRAAIDCGCQAVLVAPPYFYKNVSDEGVLAFYRQLITQVPNAKIILYHIPQLTHVPLTTFVAKALHAQFPEQIIGLKESEGNLNFTKELLSVVPGLKVYVGNEAQITEAVRLGAAGAICGIANLFPELVSQLASKQNDSIVQIMNELKQFPTLPAMKSVMAMQKGPSWQLVRPPLVPLRPEQAQVLQSFKNKVNLT